MEALSFESIFPDLQEPSFKLIIVVGLGLSSWSTRNRVEHWAIHADIPLDWMTTGEARVAYGEKGRAPFVLTYRNYAAQDCVFPLWSPRAVEKIVPHVRQRSIY